MLASSWRSTERTWTPLFSNYYAFSASFAIKFIVTDCCNVSHFILVQSWDFDDNTSLYENTGNQPVLYFIDLRKNYIYSQLHYAAI